MEAAQPPQLAEAYARESAKPPDQRAALVEFDYGRHAALEEDPSKSDEGMRILEDLLKRQLDEFEEGCLYHLATAHRQRGEMKTARQYLEMGLDRHPRSERIAEELRTLRSQVHKDGVIGVALLCGIAAAAILLLRLMRR